MTLLTLLRSQVPVEETFAASPGYSVSVHRDETSGAVSGIGWNAGSGTLAVQVVAGAQQLLAQTNLTGVGYVDLPAGHFTDEVGTSMSWSAS